jgi:hypothetical protein
MHTALTQAPLSDLSVSYRQTYTTTLRKLCAEVSTKTTDSWDGWAERLGAFLRQAVGLACAYPPFFFQARPATDIKVRLRDNLTLRSGGFHANTTLCFVCVGR